MADSVGVHAASGRLLSDWSHVEQSIAKILTTPIGARVMRRDFGSNLPDLVDAKMYRQNVLAVYAASALAINRWEPRFRIRWARVKELSASGIVSLELFGTYYPRGHKGDYTLAEDASTRIVLGSQA